MEIANPDLDRASDLTQKVLGDKTVNQAAWWWLLGHVQWEATPDLARRRPDHPTRGTPRPACLGPVRPIAFSRALEAKPDDVPALGSLAACLGVRGMKGASRQVELALARAGKSSGGPSLALAPEHPPAPAISPWSAADQLAVSYLHLGEPDSARRAWNEAPAPPSAALRLARLAEADLAALDSESAAARCRRAIELEPTLGEAWYVLAIASLESGDSQGAVAACRESLKHELTASQRQALAGVERLLSRYVPAKGE